MANILSLNISTNSLKAAVVNEKGEILGISQLVLDSIHIEHGWAEQIPNSIIETTLDLIENCLLRNSISPQSIEAIALTNLKGSVTAFNKETGEVVENFIQHNDKRVDEIFKELKTAANYDLVKQKTALFLSRDMSALKMKWIQENSTQAKELLDKGQLGFATLDTFILNRLVGKNTFITDVTNAHVTGLVNATTLDYDQDMLELFSIKRECLAKIKHTDENFGCANLHFFSRPIKILSSLCNSQSADFALGSSIRGEIKCTISRTCSILLQLNEKPPPSSDRFEVLLSQKFKESNPVYNVVSNINHAGSVVTWLQNSMGLIRTAREVEALAFSVPDSGGVFFVPTFSGIEAPFWDNTLQGSILGLKESTNIGHVARASLEGIAYQVAANIKAMLEEFNIKAKCIKCGGKMAQNSFLMQMIADLVRIEVITAQNSETALIGTALCAHLNLQNIKNLDDFTTLFKHQSIYKPKLKQKQTQMMMDNWQIALDSTKSWSNKVA